MGKGGFGVLFQVSCRDAGRIGRCAISIVVCLSIAIHTCYSQPVAQPEPTPAEILPNEPTSTPPISRSEAASTPMNVARDQLRDQLNLLRTEQQQLNQELQAPTPTALGPAASDAEIFQGIAKELADGDHQHHQRADRLKRQLLRLQRILANRRPPATSEPKSEHQDTPTAEEPHSPSPEKDQHAPESVAQSTDGPELVPGHTVHVSTSVPNGPNSGGDPGRMPVDSSDVGTADAHGTAPNPSESVAETNSKGAEHAGDAPSGQAGHDGTAGAPGADAGDQQAKLAALWLDALPITDSPVDRLGLANALFALGQIESALDIYQRLPLESVPVPERSWVQYQIACCFRKLGNRQEAESRFRQLVATQDAGIWGTYSRWWLDLIRKDAETRQLIQSLRTTLDEYRNELKKP